MPLCVSAVSECRVLILYILQSQKSFLATLIHTMFYSFTESMSEVGNFLPIEALQYPQTYSATANQRLPTEALQYPQTYSATASQRLPTEALQYPQTYSATASQRLPTEALQYPQTYSATASQRLPTEALQTYSTSGNQRLKRTYGIKRDRNRRSDQV